MGFCPQVQIGHSNTLWTYGGLVCPAGSYGTASDKRTHQLGQNCSNIIDPIGACGDVEHVCGCEATGLSRYASLNDDFHAAKPARVIGRCTATYRDGTRLRKVRLFLVDAPGPRKNHLVLRIGLELAPTTPLPAEGCFQALLVRRKRCYHCIRLDGMDGHCFHVVTRKAAKARARKSARASR
jgi:hypothetical protein